MIYAHFVKKKVYYANITCFGGVNWRNLPAELPWVSFVYFAMGDNLEIVTT